MFDLGNYTVDSLRDLLEDKIYDRIEDMKYYEDECSVGDMILEARDIIQQFINEIEDIGEDIIDNIEENY